MDFFGLVDALRHRVVVKLLKLYRFVHLSYFLTQFAEEDLDHFVGLDGVTVFVSLNK